MSLYRREIEIVLLAQHNRLNSCMEDGQEISANQIAVVVMTVACTTSSGKPEWLFFFDNNIYRKVLSANYRQYCRTYRQQLDTTYAANVLSLALIQNYCYRCTQ